MSHASVPSSAEPAELPHIIGGAAHIGDGELLDVVQPHSHHEVLGTMTNATHDDARAAVEKAQADAAAAQTPSGDETPADEKPAKAPRKRAPRRATTATAAAKAVSRSSMTASRSPSAPRSGSARGRACRSS